MKQVYKNYIFSNLKNELSNKKISKSELVLCEHYNVKTGEPFVKNADGYIEYFKNKFANIDDYEAFFNKNKEILQKINFIFDYEFFDENDYLTKIRYLCFDNEYSLYEINFESFDFIKFDFDFESFPIIQKDSKYLYLYNNKGGAVVFSDFYDPQYFDMIATIKSFAIIDDLIFFVEENHPYIVYYTDKTELINLTSDTAYYNKINLDICAGEILKIEKYKNEIYIFQKHKISSFDVHVSKNNLSDVCDLSSMIIDNTICSYDDIFVFLTTDGIKSFDGNNIKHIFKSLADNINYDYHKLSALVYNGKYFLCADYKFGSNFLNVLISCALDDEKIVFYNFDTEIESINLMLNHKEYSLLVLINDIEQRVVKLSSDTKCQKSSYMKFNKIYFDSYEIKEINFIKFLSDGRFKVKVTTDVEEKEFLVTNDKKSFNLMISGHMFQFEIYGDDNFEIESIFVELMTIEDKLWTRKLVICC